MPQKIKISHIISLGCNCHTSMFLKHCGYKSYSTPFDWISIKFRDVIDILQNNFDTFIDSKYLIDHADENPLRCGHKLYGKHMFHHFNPRNEVHKLYYERCIHRFKSLKKVPADETVLFIYNEFYDPEFTTNDIIMLRDLLYQYRGNNKFILLVIKNKCNYDKDVSEEQHTSQFKVDIFLQSLMVIECDLIGHTTGVGFSNYIDHVCTYNLLNAFFNINIDRHIANDNVEKTAHDISL